MPLDAPAYTHPARIQAELHQPPRASTSTAGGPPPIVEPVARGASDDRGYTMRVAPEQARNFEVTERVLASSTSVAEVERLLQRHRELAKAKVAGTISEAQVRELQLVRWKLDRIESVQVGPALDRLAMIANTERAFAVQLHETVDALRAATRKR